MDKAKRVDAVPSFGDIRDEKLTGNVMQTTNIL
jgi:hypothetical protein